MRPKFGRRPSAVARAMKSSDAPSIARISTLRGALAAAACRATASIGRASSVRLDRRARGTPAASPPRPRRRSTRHTAHNVRCEGVAAPAAVRDQQEQRRRHRQRERSLRHRRDRLGREHQAERREVRPHQRRTGRGRQRAQPRQHADAEPRRREQLARQQLPRHEQHVEHDRSDARRKRARPIARAAGSASGSSGRRGFRCRRTIRT